MHICIHSQENQQEEEGDMEEPLPQQRAKSIGNRLHGVLMATRPVLVVRGGGPVTAVLVKELGLLRPCQEEEEAEAEAWWQPLPL